jgi:ACS family tartrate transporter-like MFS transporter
VGNLGGFVGPTIVGYIKQATGSYAGAVTTLGCALVVLASLAITLRPEPGKTRMVTGIPKLGKYAKE